MFVQSTYRWIKQRKKKFNGNGCLLLVYSSEVESFSEVCYEGLSFVEALGH